MHGESKALRRIICVAVLPLAAWCTSCQQQEGGDPAPASSAASIPADVPRPPRAAEVPAEASALVDNLERDFPSGADALYVQGQILEQFGQSTEALWCWERCLALIPGMPMRMKASPSWR